MKTRLFLLLCGCLVLAACDVLLPQTVAEEGLGDSANQPGSDEVVVEVVEEVPVGQNVTGEIGPTTVEIVGGDEAALREFVTRWLGSSYPGQEADHITIYLGSLPPEMPNPVPLPDGAHLVASVRQTRNEFLQLMLDVPMPQDTAAAFYEEALLTAGWQAAPNDGSGGFVSTEFGLNYCLGEETSLSLQISALSEEASDVRIFIQSDAGYSPCKPDQVYGDPVYDQIPILKNPPGMRMIGGGSGSSSSGGSDDAEAYSETHLEGDLSAAEAAATYNDQLAAAGWILVESGSADGLGWSTWTFTDAEGESWTGTLIVTDIPPGSGRLFAYVRIEHAP